MEQVYSKVKEDCLLLSLVRSSDVTENRIDLSPEEEYLQVAVKQLTKGASFKPHKHNKLITLLHELDLKSDIFCSIMTRSFFLSANH